MPKFAYFDASQPSPQPVIGWLDTDAATYATMPASIDLLTLSEAQWAARSTTPAGWEVSSGTLTARVSPPILPPTLAQQAAAAVNAGLTIALSGSITLPATLFPTDAATQGKLGAVVTVLGATGSFPDGAASYPMKDASGTWHTLTAGQYKAVAGAIASYVAALDLVIDGNPFAVSALPAASIALTV